jgi:hypothetical protein
MTGVRTLMFLSIIGVVFTTASAQKPIQDFDTMGDVDCESEMARLDNFAVQLMKEPSSRGVIIFYGGLRFRGRLPRRNEAVARAARMKPYLVQRRGVPANQVLVINGGYRAEWEVEFWIIPRDKPIPDPRPLMKTINVRFRKGKANPRDYRCRI